MSELEWLLSSSVLILLVILLRFLFRNRISRRMQYALWLVVVLRLCVPVQFGELSFSTSAMAEKVEQAVVSQESASYEMVYVQPETEFETYELDGNTYAYKPLKMEWQPTEAELSLSQDRLLTCMGIVFGYAMIGLGLWFVLTNLIFRIKATKNLQKIFVPDCPIPVYISEGISSPCLIGLFRQKILLTPGATQEPERLRHIITHELTHRRHGDVFWGFVRCVLLCLYWFHPLVWWAAFLSKKDCELACDEGAIAKLGEEERIPYGETLLKMVSLSSVSRGVGRVATTMAESKRQLAQRIRCIAQKRKFRFVVAIAALCLVMAIIPVVFAGKNEELDLGFVEYYKALERKEELRHGLPELQAKEGSIYEAYKKALTQTEGVFNYSLLDMDGNGVPELALRRSDGYTYDYGFYTYEDGMAVPLSYDLPGYPETLSGSDVILDYGVALCQSNDGTVFAYLGRQEAFVLHLQQGEVIAEPVVEPAVDPELFETLPRAAALDFSLLNKVVLGKESRKTFELPKVDLEIPENWVELQREENGQFQNVPAPNARYNVVSDGKTLGFVEGGGVRNPNVLFLEDGRLEGWNNGEWGGGVYYRADSGEITELIYDNFISYYVENGRIFVFTGTNHLGLNEGSFYEIYKEDGEYKSKMITNLNGTPHAITVVGDYCFVQTYFEIYIFLHGRLEKITLIDSGPYNDGHNWWLNGSSMIYANGRLYVQRMGHVMAFDINEESFTWYVPKEGWGKDEKYGKNL